MLAEKDPTSAPHHADIYQNALLSSCRQGTSAVEHSNLAISASQRGKRHCEVASWIMDSKNYASVGMFSGTNEIAARFQLALAAYEADQAQYHYQQSARLSGLAIYNLQQAERFIPVEDLETARRNKMISRITTRLQKKRLKRAK